MGMRLAPALTCVLYCVDVLTREIKRCNKKVECL